jgi:glycosyltransferase involved in cell wall biosynthesis
MSCGKPCLAANRGFEETLGQYADRLLFRYGDSEDLAERLKWVLSLNEEERGYLGVYLREQVVNMHSLERLVDRLLEVFKNFQRRKTIVADVESMDN